MIKCLLSFIFLLFTSCTFGQEVNIIGEPLEEPLDIQIFDYVKIDTLIDVKSGVKFVLDKSRTTITAICNDGETLWKTKPAEDSGLPPYRKEHRYIIHFDIHNYYITVSYNNSQSGYLNPANGKFQFIGQD